VGYEYIQWVLPEPSRMEYLPPGAVLESIVHDLHSSGWLASPLEVLRLRHPVGGKPESLRVPLPALATTTEQLLASSGAVLVELPPNETLPPEDPDKPYDTISAARCYSAKILLSEKLCLVPSDGVQDGKLVCHGCGGDLSPQLDDGSIPNLWFPFWGARDFPSGDNAHCLRCGIALLSAQIWHHATYQASTHSPKDQAPFFRFALVLSDGSPSLDPAQLDPGLAAILTTRTAVRFRSCGRWV
jgi:hypothetical protein